MGVFLPPTLPRLLFEKGRLCPDRTHLFVLNESKVEQQREIILALERRHTYNKGHNNRVTHDNYHLACECTRYKNSTKGMSSN